VSAGRWERVAGSISRTEDGWTRISVTAYGKGQVIDVRTARLQNFPNLLSAILDRVVRDIETRLA
jgi:hypothetical protein